MNWVQYSVTFSKTVVRELEFIVFFSQFTINFFLTNMKSGILCFGGMVVRKLRICVCVSHFRVFYFLLSFVDDWVWFERKIFS